MLVSELRDDCAAMVADANLAEISASTWLRLIASAARDARNSGWLIYLEDDESLEAASTTFEYAVPASFAYVEKLLVEDTINSTSVYLNEVPRSHWDIRTNGGNPVFTFTTITELIPGNNIKVVGQKRPTIYTAASDTIDAGMESFLRERSLFFAFRILGAGMSELARWRQQMSVQSAQISEGFLRRHPQEFRALPSSIVVPGRA